MAVAEDSERTSLPFSAWWTFSGEAYSKIDPAQSRVFNISI